MSKMTIEEFEKKYEPTPQEKERFEQITKNRKAGNMEVNITLMNIKEEQL